MDPFRQLQVLTLVVLTLLFAPAAVPPLRPKAGWLRWMAFGLYFAGSLAILVNWWLTKNWLPT